MAPQYLGLHKEMWARQQAALKRAQPAAVQQAATAKQVRWCRSVASFRPARDFPIWSKTRFDIVK